MRRENTQQNQQATHPSGIPFPTRPGNVAARAVVPPSPPMTRASCCAPKASIYSPVMPQTILKGIALPLILSLASFLASAA